jgi:hypothetical protein
MVACGPQAVQVNAYGIVCVGEWDAGICTPCQTPQLYDPNTDSCVSPVLDPGPVDAGLDSGLSDSGTLTDGGSDGQSFVGTDAYGIPPFHDAGQGDGGSESGSDD